MDDETSLVYMKARFYDPDSGRFLTEDSYLGQQDLPPSLNRYLYAYGNPTRFFDPDGHKLQDFQDMGTQAYSEGNYIEAGVIAIAQAFYETADGILGGTVEDASVALQKQQSLSDASREFASKQVEKASEVIEEYAEETATGIIIGAGTAYACSKARAVCNAIEDNAGKLYDKANKAFGDKKSKGDGSAKVTEEDKTSPARISDEKVKAETSSDTSLADKDARKRELKEKFNHKEDLNKEINKNGKLKVKPGAQQNPNRNTNKEEWNQSESDRRFDNRRRKGVKRFWSEERKKLKNGSEPTRNWDGDQTKDIINRRTPKYKGEPIEGHHKKSARQYPQDADKADNIYPATNDEHFNRWHDGNYQNKTHGKPLNPGYEENF